MKLIPSQCFLNDVEDSGRFASLFDKNQQPCYAYRLPYNKCLRTIPDSQKKQKESFLALSVDVELQAV